MLIVLHYMATKLRDDHVFTDALIGVSLLDIDQKRVTLWQYFRGKPRRPTDLWII